MDKNSVYTDLLVRHHEELWHMCWQHAGGDRDRCGDLLQDVYIALWENLDKLRPNATAGEKHQWVRWQARSVFNQTDRKKKLLTVPIADNLSDTVADEEALHRKETLDNLLSSLDADEQRMFRLYLEGYSGDEIGRQMGISRNNYYQRFHRSIQKMRRLVLILLALLFGSALAISIVPQWRHFFFGGHETEKKVLDSSTIESEPLSDSVPLTISSRHINNGNFPVIERMPPLDISEMICRQFKSDTLVPCHIPDSITAWVCRGTLFISGAQNETVRVYTVNGRLVAARKADKLCIIDLFPSDNFMTQSKCFDFILEIGNYPKMQVQL